MLYPPPNVNKLEHIRANIHRIHRIICLQYIEFNQNTEDIEYNRIQQNTIEYNRTQQNTIEIQATVQATRDVRNQPKKNNEK